MSKTVEKMLTQDIDLKKELDQKFELIYKKQAKIGHKQNFVMALIGVCIIVVFIAGIFYYDKTRELFFNAMKEEMRLLDLKKDSVRFDRELNFRSRDTTKVFVMPIRDTIKINGNNNN